MRREVGSLPPRLRESPSRGASRRAHGSASALSEAIALMNVVRCLGSCPLPIVTVGAYRGAQGLPFFLVIPKVAPLSAMSSMRCFLDLRDFARFFVSQVLA